MKKILIIVPDGGMLFEAAGIADILMQANRLHPGGLAQPCYRIIIATTQPHHDRVSVGYPGAIRRGNVQPTPISDWRSITGG